MARTDNLEDFLTDVATAIKTKTEKTDKIPAANFDTEISNISTLSRNLKLIEKSIKQIVSTDTCELKILDSNNNELSKDDKDTYTTENLPISILTTQNGYKMDTVTYNSDLPSELNIEFKDNTNFFRSRNKSNYDTNVLDVTNTSYSVYGDTPTISSYEGYSAIKTTGSNGITYTLNISNYYYDIEFKFYKSNTDAYSRCVYVIGPNYEIEVKGSSGSVYWGSDYTSTWKQNAWNTMRLVKPLNSNDVSLYINGDLVATKTYSASVTAIRFGYGSDTDNFFTGYYADLMVKNLSYSVLQPDISITETDLVRNQDKTVTSNGSYTADEGYTGLGTVTVKVESGTEDTAKLFETEEDMQADSSAVDGDLAVVYRSEIAGITNKCVASSVLIPEKIVFDSTIVSFNYGSFRGTEATIYLDYSATSVSISIQGSSYINIFYTSTDGINYTTTSTYAGQTINLGEKVTFTNADGNWDDNFGKILQVGSMIFGGLYQYDDDYINQNELQIMKASDITFDLSSTEVSNIQVNKSENLLYFDLDKIYSICRKYISTETTVDNKTFYLYTGSDNNLYAYVYSDATSYFSRCVYDSDKNFIGMGFSLVSSPSGKLNIFRFDFDNSVYEIVKTIDCSTTTFLLKYLDSKNQWAILTPSLLYNFSDSFVGELYVSTTSFINPRSIRIYIGTDTGNSISDGLRSNANDWLLLEPKYIVANTQFDAIDTSVYDGKKYYGENATGIGTLGSDITADFADTNNAVYWKVMNYYDNMEPMVITKTSSALAGKSITILPIKTNGDALLDVSNVTSCYYMFYNCRLLKKVSLFDTSNITNMQAMFYYCTSLESVPQLDTSNITNMQAMFSRCTSLESIPEFDTKNVTTMAEMFYYCTSLESVPQFDTKNVTSMTYMFSGCTSLESIPEFDTKNVTNMAEMFSGCTSLESVPQLDTSNITNMREMFSRCTSLESIPEFDTSNITNMQAMFYYCTSLESVPQLDTSNITNMREMFSGCTSLSDTSLNNILSMCANASSYTGTKTLVYIGLTSEQATTCTTLSNYSTFTSAGWTTGY